MALPTTIRVWSCKAEPTAATLASQASLNDLCISVDDGRIWQLTATGPNVWSRYSYPTFAPGSDQWLNSSGAVVPATDPTATTLLCRAGQPLDLDRAYRLGVTS